MNKKQFFLGLLVVCLFACKDVTKQSDEQNESAIEQTDDEEVKRKLLFGDKLML